MARPNFLHFHRLKQKCLDYHVRVPILKHIPLAAIAIIVALLLVNAGIWAVVAVVLAIDLMTRRLIATGQRPVTVGTFFSLGHSTIVIITSIIVAATAAGISSRFDSFSRVGGIIGTSVSAAFLLLLGIMNGYILYKLIQHLRHVIDTDPASEDDDTEGKSFKIEGHGCMFALLRWAFRVVDRPWKMYPLGVLFGLGFDTSSEIALLGISTGMCLLDTLDAALMLSLYTSTSKGLNHTALSPTNPLLFLYTTTILTVLTVLVAITVGTLQLLQLILNLKFPNGEVPDNMGGWKGVQNAGDAYDLIGAGICGGFIIVGLAGWAGWGAFLRWVERRRERIMREREVVVDEDENGNEEVVRVAEERSEGDRKRTADASTDAIV
ncbi:MAG: hypothetical protein M1834_002421 [Cirrosporium novae-zelandiae]|nr:MAG: hypothetical protein M1834_002421 [Cirrosporium novae-zelandiae]